MLRVLVLVLSDELVPTERTLVIEIGEDEIVGKFIEELLGSWVGNVPRVEIVWLPVNVPLLVSATMPEVRVGDEDDWLKLPPLAVV